MQVVILSSPERQEMVEPMLDNIESSIGSGKCSIDVINNPNTFGKKNFWKRYKQAFEICKESEYDNYMIIPDDITKIDLDTINDLFKKFKGKKFVCATTSDNRESCWNSKPNPSKGFKLNDYDFTDIQFFDCGGITNRATIQNIDIDEVPKGWFDTSGKSSGVGCQLTEKFRKARIPMYNSNPSLSFHGDHDSVMHKEERKKTPLISRHTKDMRVVIGIATFGGREKNLAKTLESLKGQADRIVIYDNEKPNLKDLADNGKFWDLQNIDSECYYFSCDDDIIYPPNYVNDMVQAIDKHGCIVTHHGRILKGLDRSYYGKHINHSCKAMNPKECELDVAGTGVTAFKLSYFHPKELHLAKDLRMSDLVFSLEAAKQQKKIVHLKRPLQYFGIQDIPVEQTIYGMEHKREGRQIEIANEIYTLNYG